MEDKRFDALTRSLAQGTSRRRVLKGLLGGLVGGAALGGVGKVSAQDTEDEVLDQSTEVTEAPPSDTTVEEPPPDTTVEETTPAPAVEETTPAPPVEESPADTPATEPAQESLAETAEEGTPTDAAGPALACEEGWIPCETLCCEPGWRCCGIYCIPDREDSCCADIECPVCEICSLDGICFSPCTEELGLQCCVDEERQLWTCAECCRDDPECFDFVDCEFCAEIGQECCIDEKHHTVTCAYCCDDSDCNRENCEVCHGGYCLTCFDQTDGHAPICAFQCVAPVSASDDGGGFCVQCCFDEQCGPCERCHDGWCEVGCDAHEQCCQVDVVAADIVNGGVCAECCGSEDCHGDCERCLEGTCIYPCSDREICCHGDFCALEEEGCCGVLGDWCEIDLVNAADANLNGSCCGELVCCHDDKTKGTTCAQCCHDGHCPPDWHCCGGTCNPECCDDKDCERGVCAEGFCVECRDNHDCHKDEICCDGRCFTEFACCFENAPDPVNCGDCETCFEGFCRPTGVGLFGVCNPMVVSIADDGSPQLNCCDGLVCCETKEQGLICLECCSDHDCAHGCECHDGVCSCACGSDKDCPKDTCCCKNGSCSADCCPKKPDKPGKPDDKPDDKPADSGTSVGGETVATLPSTGTGSSQSNTGWLGAAALGAAAAYLASKKLKDESPETQPAEE